MLHPPPGVTLRTATLDDVPACARLHMECWRATYGPIVDPRLLEARLDVPRTEESWRSHLLSGRRRLLAVRDDEPVGFSASGPGRDEDAPTGLELYALYVREADWGLGIGRLLLAEELEGRDASLWVLEDNARARGFYARHGFEPDGARKKYAPLDGWELRLVRRTGGHPVRA